MAGNIHKKKKVSPPKLEPGNSGGVNKNNSAVNLPDWAIYAVIVFTALIYARALFNDFASLDDNVYVLNNPFIRDFSFNGIKKIFSSFYDGNYLPLTNFTYLIAYRLFGLNPVPYHALNVALHLINVLLAYKLAEKLSGNKQTALIVAVLFALHPMHVESVAWISELKDVLYTCFYLSALIAYLNYLKSEYKLNYYGLCLGFFALALLSKSAAVTLPVLMLAIDLYKGRNRSSKIFFEKVPFFVLSIFFGILALMSQQIAMLKVSALFSPVDRIFLFTYTLSFYLIKAVVPFSLSAMHYYPESGGGALPVIYYLSLPFLLILTGLVVRPSKFRREKLFGTFFFLIVISIMLQVISVGNAITAERYTYVAYIGLFYSAGQWISSLSKASVQKYAVMIVGLVVVLFSYLTWERIGVWKNGDELMTDIIKKQPDSYQAWCLRGDYKRDNHDIQGALQDYNKSLELKPDNQLCLIDRSQIFIELKDYPAVLQDCNAALRLDPSAVNAYINRGIAYDGLGNKTAEMQDYDRAIELNPDSQLAYKNRGVLKYETGNIPGAITDMNRAIRLDNTDALAWFALGVFKSLQGDYTGSIEDFTTSIRLKPDDARVYLNRALSKLKIKDIPGACEDFHKAHELGNKEAEGYIKQYCN